jgi:Flp pilus assembly protein TadD
MQKTSVTLLAILCITALILSACSSLATKPGLNEAGLNNPDNLLTLLDPNVISEQEALAQAESLLTQGKPDNALFYFVKALQFNPKNAKAMERIALIHTRSKHPDLALKVYKDILAIDKQNVLANEYVGLYLLENGMNGKAKEHLNTVVNNSNNSWKAHNGLGVLADLEYNTSEAIAHYEAAIEIDHTNPMLLNNLGYSYYLAGQENRAKILFKQALGFDNKYKRAIHNLALIHIKNGNFNHAVALFNRIMPSYDSFNNIGYIAMLNGQYDAAEEYLRKAIDENPVYFQKAQENLKNLLELKPSGGRYQANGDQIREIHIAPNLQPTSDEGTPVPDVPQTSEQRTTPALAPAVSVKSESLVRQPIASKNKKKVTSAQQIAEKQNKKKTKPEAHELSSTKKTKSGYHRDPSFIAKKDVSKEAKAVISTQDKDKIAVPQASESSTPSQNEKNVKDTYQPIEATHSAPIPASIDNSQLSKAETSSSLDPKPLTSQTVSTPAPVNEQKNKADLSPSTNIQTSVSAEESKATQGQPNENNQAIASSPSTESNKDLDKLDKVDYSDSRPVTTGNSQLNKPEALPVINQKPITTHQPGSTPSSVNAQKKKKH